MSGKTAPLNPRPEVSAASPWTFPDSHHEQLDSGLRVVRVPIPGQQVVTVELGLDVPLTAEEPTQLGVASLVLTSSDEGTQKHPGAELAEAIESIGASYDGACGLTSSSVSIEVPRRHLDQALELLAEIITSSALADADVLRQMAQARAQLAQAAQNGPSLAGLAVSREVWPLGDRASRPIGGTATTLDAITPDDVRAFRDATWLPAGGVIVLAGDGVDQVDLGAFSQWTGARAGEAGKVRWDQLRNDGPTRVLLVDRPDAVQADVRIQTRVPGRQDPRWAALKVACGVLGGTFGSRLNTVLREQKGWSYGVSAMARALRDGGLVTVGGAFRAEVAAQAVRTALDLVDPASARLEEAEVRDARNHAVGVAPLQYDTAGAVASQVTTLEMAGLTGEWVDQLMADTAAVTADRANRAWHELLPASAWRVGIAGPAATLGPALEEAGFMVEVISPSELLG